jgi:hypothetical protein
MSKQKKPVFPNSELAVVAGVCCLVAAAWCFQDAWEKRGKDRPWPARWLAV